ncbi:RagB/SusD family nutrient uptake outer membrane protein [Mangrovibacterium lignilyticum]|uniref:RagB/SusD family nutrient uptake outer membrane protein n=1 Tax=Mangrovibacterium lignilyticum TaxID=2668052 RepID=UPI0013D15CFF|nr:RagB/SusD family nutrient uptake outer membrane protein [Mangrovibacterium lignilyticum]
MKLLKYILFSLVIFSFTSCTDLEEDPYTFLSPSNFYQSADDLEMALTSVYDGYQETFVRYYKYIMQLEVMTEFGAPAYAKDNVHLWNVWSDINNADKMVFGNWDDAYATINRANLVVGRGADIDMDEDLKAQYFAEARFLRAATYFNLVRMYGGLPIPESFTEGLEGLEVSRSTVEETYNYIVADLEYAIANLPKKSEYASSDVWRASQGAAQALLGDVYLTMGDMLSNDSYYQQAKDYLGAVIQSTEYELEPDFKDLWYWWNTGNKNGVESVFEIQFGNYGNEYNNLHVMFGVNITEATIGCYMYRRFGPTIDHYLSYSDDDARKEGTFLTRFYQTEKGNTSNILDTLVFVPEDKGFYPGTRGWKTASPGNIKFYDRTEESASLKKPQADFYAIRYADVLLNYAEAENNLNGASADAYEKIDMVRTRAGLDDLPAGLSTEQMADSIYRERGFELVGEGQLFFDELRTNRIGENVSNHVAWGVTQGIYMYTPLEFVPSKDFLFKIPQYDLDSNPALTQNDDNVSQ